MPTTRRRRIVRRVLLLLAGGVLLYAVWLMAREPPEIERSRGIKLGMTPLEVEAVMQTSKVGGLTLPDGREMWMFGAVSRSRDRLTFTLEKWLGVPIGDLTVARYPVRVRFNMDWRADRIERGDEVEEASL